MPYQTFQGSLDATNLRIGLIVSRFNEFITEQLAKGALEVLRARGCPDENIFFKKVPGAWELAIAFGVLTTEDMQQAMDRAGGKSGNKGAEAAEVAIELANLIRDLKGAR